MRWRLWRRGLQRVGGAIDVVWRGALAKMGLERGRGAVRLSSPIVPRGEMGRDREEEEAFVVGGDGEEGEELVERGRVGGR